MTQQLAEKSENKIQQEIVMWYRSNFCLKHHHPCCLIASIPNGGKRDPKEAMTLKGTGLYTGFSDLIVIHKKGHEKGVVIFIEVKTPDGVISPDQMEFCIHARHLDYPYHVVRSLSDFKSIIHAL